VDMLGETGQEHGRLARRVSHGSSVRRLRIARSEERGEQRPWPQSPLKAGNSEKLPALGDCIPRPQDAQRGPKRPEAGRYEQSHAGCRNPFGIPLLGSTGQKRDFSRGNGGHQQGC
jgi:hypothetical protein